MKLVLILCTVIMALSAECLFAADTDKQGYLCRPPVFIDNEPDVPLAGLGIAMPPKGKLLPDFDALVYESKEFRSEGQIVQPDLSVKEEIERLSMLYGVSQDWAVGLSIPYSRIKVMGLIGGEPASGINQSIGDVMIAAKKRLWNGKCGQTLVVTAGIELPTGDDDDQFAQDNAVTNGYYSTFPRRMPLSWQPGSGTVDGYLALAYGKVGGGRLSWQGLAATKLHSSGDEDVKIGDIFILGGTATYGVTNDFAAALSLTLRSQADDDYPNAPAPGVNSAALAGTTTHGTTLYLDPSIRYNFKNLIVVGVGVRFPVVKPDDGLVPDTRVFLIFYPPL